jgi:hypothetical protein
VRGWLDACARRRLMPTTTTLVGGVGFECLFITSLIREALVASGEQLHASHTQTSRS